AELIRVARVSLFACRRLRRWLSGLFKRKLAALVFLSRLLESGRGGRLGGAHGGGARRRRGALILETEIFRMGLRRGWFGSVGVERELFRFCLFRRLVVELKAVLVRFRRVWLSRPGGFV